jgi:hypothetical protein
MTATAKPPPTGAVAVVVEPRRYVKALELGISLAGSAEEELIVLAPRPRLLRDTLRLAGYDPDELTEEAAAATEGAVRRLIGGLAPDLPYRLLKVDDPHFASLVRLAESYRCSILVVPRRAGARVRFQRRRAARSAQLEFVVAP